MYIVHLQTTALLNYHSLLTLHPWPAANPQVSPSFWDRILSPLLLLLITSNFVVYVCIQQKIIHYSSIVLSGRWNGVCVFENLYSWLCSVWNGRSRLNVNWFVSMGIGMKDQSADDGTWEQQQQMYKSPLQMQERREICKYVLRRESACIIRNWKWMYLLMYIGWTQPTYRWPCARLNKCPLSVVIGLMNFHYLL
jgi:hypothetical protein